MPSRQPVGGFLTVGRSTQYAGVIKSRRESGVRGRLSTRYTRCTENDDMKIKVDMYSWKFRPDIGEKLVRTYTFMAPTSIRMADPVFSCAHDGKRVVIGVAGSGEDGEDSGTTGSSIAAECCRSSRGEEEAASRCHLHDKRTKC